MKLNKNKQKIFYIKDQILNLYLLVLKFLFNTILNIIYKGLKVIKSLLKKGFEFFPSN